MTLKANGTFERRVPLPPRGEIAIMNGTWRLEGADISLEGFRFSDPSTDEWNRKYAGRARFYVTKWFSRELRPFGGDTPDPDTWEIWQRVAAPANKRINAPVRTVTALAKSASAAPVRPARYAQR